MKRHRYIYASIILTGLLFCSAAFKKTTPNPKDIIKTSLRGAWQTGTDESRMVLIFSDGYFSLSHYNLNGKKFISTDGGKWRLDGNTLIKTFEFNTSDPAKVGREESVSIKVSGNKMSVSTGKENESWQRIDAGDPGKLAGAWLITGRYQDGEMRTRTPGARKTMKILSGTRFQWIAYNTETKEFSGTGGGTYTTENGKYTETIEFFSRDSSRVGMNLRFDFSLEDGNWRHQGLSSKGDPIDEIWTRREKLDQ